MKKRRVLTTVLAVLLFLAAGGYIGFLQLRGFCTQTVLLFPFGKDSVIEWREALGFNDVQQTRIWRITNGSMSCDKTLDGWWMVDGSELVNTKAKLGHTFFVSLSGDIKHPEVRRQGPGLDLVWTMQSGWVERSSSWRAAPLAAKESGKKMFSGDGFFTVVGASNRRRVNVEYVKADGYSEVRDQFWAIDNNLDVHLEDGTVLGLDRLPASFYESQITCAPDLKSAIVVGIYNNVEQIGLIEKAGKAPAKKRP